MNKSLLALSSALALLSVTPAHAAGLAGQPYMGVEFGSGHATLKDKQYNTGVQTSGDNTNADVYFGYAFSKYLAVQLNAGANTSKISKSGSGYEANAKIQNYQSIYVRGTLPFQDRWSLYGLAGYTRAQLNGHVSGNGYTGDYNKAKGSFSYGAGLELYGTTNTAFTLSYTRLFDAKVDGVNVTYDTASIGLIHYFSWPKLRR